MFALHVAKPSSIMLPHTITNKSNPWAQIQDIPWSLGVRVKEKEKKKEEE